MKNYQKILGGLAVFTAAAASGVMFTASTHTVGAATFNGHGVDMMPGISTEQRADMQERHEAIEAAIENNDYDAWKNTMDQRVNITDVVTKENFDQFTEMHRLMEAGEFEKAQEIRDELGLQAPHGGMGPRGHHMHHHGF